MTLDNISNDIPSQFSGKKNIEVFLSAFQRQLDELFSVFEELNLRTDLDSANGVNLDMVGNILSLSRKDAYVILRTEKDAVISDDVYRQVLKYKTLQNNSDCTYFDIVQSIHMLWGAENIRYTENPDIPATIQISVDDASIDGMDALFGRATALKSSGVKMVYKHGYNGVIDERGIESFILNSIKHHMAIDFLRHDKFLDGTKLLDGTNILDGLSTIGIRVGFAAKGYSINNFHEVDTRAITLTAILKNQINQIIASKNSYGINFWKAGFLDGEETLDGSHLLDSKRGDMKASVCTSLKAAGPTSSIGSVSITTYNSDFRLLRGTKALDGAKMLNSIYRKEDVQ